MVHWHLGYLCLVRLIPDPQNYRTQMTLLGSFSFGKNQLQCSICQGTVTLEQ